VLLIYIRTVFGASDLLLEVDLIIRTTPPDWIILAIKIYCKNCCRYTYTSKPQLFGCSDLCQFTDRKPILFNDGKRELHCLCLAISKIL